MFRRPAAWLCVACFLVLGILAIPTLGFEDDELIFVNLFFHPNDAFSRLPLGGDHAVPAMAASYAGAFKTWLWSPLLLVEGYPGVWGVRLPALLLTCGAVLLGGLLLRWIAGEIAGPVMVILLSTDATFLFTGVFDWGPVVLQHLLLLSLILLLLLWHRSGEGRWLVLSGVVLGVALWDKAVFLWQASGLLIAFATVAPGLLWRSLTRRTLMLLGQGLLLGALPLLIANARHHFATFKDNGHYYLPGIPAKATYMRDALNGRAATAFLVDGETQARDTVARPFRDLAISAVELAGAQPSLWRFEWGMLVVAAGVSLARAGQRRWLLFFVVSGVAGWLQSAATLNAGEMPHHAVLFWMNWYGAIAISIAVLANTRLRFAALASLTGIAVWGVVILVANYGAILMHPATARWTNADQRLAGALGASHVQRVLIADWGIRNVLRVRTGDRLAMNNQSVPLMLGHFDQGIFEACAQDKTCAVVRHAPRREVFPHVAETLDRGLVQGHFRVVSVQTVDDTHNEPAFQIVELRLGDGAVSRRE